MVAYLKKPTGSKGFQEIIATVRIVDNGEQEINATVDGKEFTITKSSVRRHLQLSNADGISVLPNTEIFDQLTLLGYVLTDDKLTFKKAEEGKGSGNPSEPQPPPSTAQPTHEEPIPNIESSSPQKTQSPRQALNKDTELPKTNVPIPHVPNEAVHQERGDSVERAATTATSLEVVQDSSNIAKTQSTAIPIEPISQETSSDGSPKRQETMGVPLFKLGIDNFMYKIVRQGSSFGNRLKVDKEDDDMALEDSSKQGRMIEEIDQDVGVTLVTPTKVSSQEDQPEDQLGVLSAAKVLADAARVHYTLIVEEMSCLYWHSEWEDSMPVGYTTPTHIPLRPNLGVLKQRQERAGYEAAIRLQE
ncbi:hypothetical protein Tco_0218285 [Tanacetum coccineum]